jgi:DeoR/GlpR family transcriptional regulator of sugar metabolism
MTKRDTKILETLTSRGRTEVSELAEQLGVSAVTMRKDLDALQAQGLVVREHGFATLSNPNDVGGRLAYHYQEKLAIARCGAELVSDGETVMIENGSCCALLARQIADTKRDVTIVTNSVFIAEYVRDAPDVHVTLLGGAIQPDSQVAVGPLVRTCAREFVVESLFIGADGWIDGMSFTNNDQMRAEAVRTMAESAARVVVLTESEKFSRRGSVPLRLGSRRISVITDQLVPEAARASLVRDNVDVILAEPDTNK